MNFKATLMIASATLLFGATASAQSSGTIIVRETVPDQKAAIIANSPEDIALQEEIRKIRAYNAYIDSTVGISDNPVSVQPYQGGQVEIFAQPTTQITYSTTQQPGQTFKVTPTTTVIQRQPFAGSTSIHRVAQGDTLYSLARTQCVSVSDIQNQNGLSDANIRLGQVLTLPGSQCPGASTGAGNVVTTNTGSYVRQVQPVPIRVDINDTKYAVLPKDTLYSISRSYCTTAQAIAGANGIAASDAIHPGQMLKLPENACVK